MTISLRFSRNLGNNGTLRDIETNAYIEPNQDTG